MQELNCFVAGFGAVQSGGETSEFLKSIHVNIIKDSTCQSLYDDYDEKIEFCAGIFMNMKFGLRVLNS